MSTPAFRSLYLPPFRIDITSRAGLRRVVPGAALGRTLRAALVACGAPEPASLGLILADDAELADLNATHMRTAGPTDVLSFPLLPREAFPPHEGASALEGEPVSRSEPTGDRAFLLPPATRLHLGDIVVSVERAVEQADGGRGGQTGDVRWSAADELKLLVVHGALHLCGWDHAEPEEEAAMRAQERAILAGLADASPTGA